MRQTYNVIATNKAESEPERIATSSHIIGKDNFLELVRWKKNGFSLLHWNRGGWSIAQQHEIGKRHYVTCPGAIKPEHLPCEPEPYGTAEQLFSAISNFLAEAVALSNDEIALLAFFVFASYFADGAAVSPCLLLEGPSAFDAISVLKSLACVCRNPVLLANSSPVGLVQGRSSTRLLCQLDAEFERTLPAMLFSDFGFTNAGVLHHISGVTAVYVGQKPLRSQFADACLSLSVPPQAGSMDTDRHLAVAEKLRNQLLQYRLQNYSRVRSECFAAPDLHTSMRELCRTLGRCIVDAPHLRDHLCAILRTRDQACLVAAGSSQRAVVLEALLALCHERKTRAHVGEVTQLANTILVRDGDNGSLKPKEVGCLLRRLGLPTTRVDKAGRGIFLLSPECRRIHDLARAYNVPAVREGLAGCPYCHPDARHALSARDAHILEEARDESPARADIS